MLQGECGAVEGVFGHATQEADLGAGGDGGEGGEKGQR